MTENFEKNLFLGELNKAYVVLTVNVVKIVWRATCKAAWETRR
jgi:hypothetical protein